VYIGKRVGDTVLYFGCRKKDEDYLYEEELADYTKDGTISQLHVAFSRDEVTRGVGWGSLTMSRGRVGGKIARWDSERHPTPL
jgi:hypothetical protein